MTLHPGVTAPGQIGTADPNYDSMAGNVVLDD